MKKGLTFTVIAQAQSLNYGEGISNIAELKKLTRADGNVYTFASRQCLRYDIVRLASELFNWNLQVVDKSKGTIQFKDDMTIKDSQEMDLFGYMKTSKKDDKDKGGSSTREAVVRLSNATSLESFNSDLDFLTNMGLAKRKNYANDIAQSEIHRSYYAYTITIDLDKVGIDGDDCIENEEKAQRVEQLLRTVEFLYRDIRGRRENLSPLFVVGGVFKRKNPYFSNALVVKNNKVEVTPIESILKSMGDDQENVRIGVIKGIFDNEKELESSLNVTTVGEAFESIIQDMKKMYE